MQSDQLKGMLDRAIAIFATMLLGWMVKRGWIGESDSAAVFPATILLPSLVYGWWVNRDKALLQSAATVPGTVVVTTPALALDTPGEKNIVSNSLPASVIAHAVATEAATVAVPLAIKPTPTDAPH